MTVDTMRSGTLQVGWTRFARLAGLLPWRSLRVLLTREFSVAEASFVLMAGFLLAALLGAVRQVLFHAQFGAGSEASAFYAALRLPDVLFNLLAGGTLSSALIPVLLRTARREGQAAAARLTAQVLTSLWIGVALLVLLLEVCAPFFVRVVLAPGFAESTSRLTIILTRLMLVQPLLLVLGAVATAVLNSRNQFLLTALALLSHNMGLLGGIVLTQWWPGLGIYGAALGVIGGALGQTIILLPGLAALRRRPWPVWNPLDCHLREVARLLIPNGLSATVNYACLVMGTAFASLVQEPVALVADYNAWLLVEVSIALLGQTVAQAVFPRLAAHGDASDWQGLRRTLLRALGVVNGGSILVVMALVVWGRPLIALLFERGEFDAAVGELTYRLLVIYALCLPAYVSTELITGGWLALRDARTPLLINLVQFGMRLTLLTMSIGRLGVMAIPLAFTTTITMETLLLGSLLLRWIRQKERGTPKTQSVPVSLRG